MENKSGLDKVKKGNKMFRTHAHTNPGDKSVPRRYYVGKMRVPYFVWWVFATIEFGGK